jgi:hypothetical protein
VTVAARPSLPPSPLSKSLFSSGCPRPFDPLDCWRLVSDAALYHRDPRLPTAASRPCVRAIMIAIRRLAKRFSKQTLSEVKPAPLSETVDHTVEEEAGELPQKAFQNPSTPLSPYPSLTLSSPASSGEDDDSEEEDDMNNRSDLRLPIGHTQHKPSSDWSTELLERRVCVRRRQRVAASRGDLPVERVPSAEKRKYSQYKCSVGKPSTSGLLTS